jgi:hypothetical protein
LAECSRFRYRTGLGFVADGLDQLPSLLILGVANAKEDVMTLLCPRLAQRAANISHPDDCDLHDRFSLV